MEEEVDEVVETTSPQGTQAFGRRLGKLLKVGDCVALHGQLGAGKTVLVRGIAEGLGLEDPRMVSSPTFVLVQEYPASIPVHHIDLYRVVSGTGELGSLGIHEMLAAGVVVIEWAERAGPSLPRPRWEVTIEVLTQRLRRLHLKRVE